jgi:hypothetical protein
MHSCCSRSHFSTPSGAEIVWTASGGSDGSSRAYTTSFGSAGNATQTFDFYANGTSGSFSGVPFSVQAGSLKWSVNFTAATDDTKRQSKTGAASDGITLRYRLSDLSSSSLASRADTEDNRLLLRVLAAAPNKPSANMTTYYLTLSATSGSTSTNAVALVELFDVALVDGVPVTIQHTIEVVSVDETSAAYELILAFPPFNDSLYYDPSIGLGVLLGETDRDDGAGGGSGDDNTALVVATAVAVPVAVVVVITVAIVGSVLYHHKRKCARKAIKKKVKAAMEEGL